jgi:hypothetical protein
MGLWSQGGLFDTILLPSPLYRGPMTSSRHSLIFAAARRRHSTRVHHRDIAGCSSKHELTPEQGTGRYGAYEPRSATSFGTPRADQRRADEFQQLATDSIATFKDYRAAAA